MFVARKYIDSFRVHQPGLRRWNLDPLKRFVWRSGRGKELAQTLFLPLKLLQERRNKNRSAAHKIVVVFDFLFGIFVTHTDDYHQHDYFVRSFPICCMFK